MKTQKGVSIFLQNTAEVFAKSSLVKAATSKHHKFDDNIVREKSFRVSRK